MITYGVDVHAFYQTGLDIGLVKAEGFDFLIVKATQGSTGYWAPPEFDSWISEARNLGMIVGAYHWCTTSNPVTQVDYFLRRLGDHTQYPLIQLDIGTDVNIDTVRKWVAEWNRRTNNHPLFLYPEKPTSLKYSDLTALGHLWDSDYVSGSGVASVLYEKVPASWWDHGATILQFSSHVDAGGLSANVDGNAFRGTRQDLERLLKIRETPTEDAMILAKDASGQVYLCDGLVSRPIDATAVNDLKYLAGQGLVSLYSGPAGAEWDSNGIRIGWYEAAFGAVPRETKSATLSAQDKTDIASNIASELLATINLVQKGQ